MNASIPQSEIQKLGKLMAIYQQSFNKDAKEFLLQQAKGYVKDLVKYTQPVASEGDMTPKKRGEAAVKRDILRAVSPFDTKGIKDEKLKKRLNKLVRDDDTDAIQKILGNIPSMNKLKLVDFSPSLHTRVRRYSSQSAIRVPKSYNKVTLDKEPLKDYIKKVQERVGRLRASWLPAARLVGVTLPGWISRHSSWSNTKGSAKLTLTDKEQSLTITNSVQPNGIMKNTANFVAKLRHENMLKDYKIKLAYLIKKLNGGQI